ncbi:hypothetical protein ACF0H5_007404 [Mactra antiquata]
MSLLNLNAQNSDDIEFGIFRHEDEDEAYLKRLSVYATVRPGNLKGTVRDHTTEGHRSLSDLLQGWDIKQTPVDESVEEEQYLPEQLELRDHELCVKGFDIDSRIVPGYRYYVRYIGTNEYLFNGEARRLLSIGLGYGRRMTFEGDSLNFNDNYFWSDSIPEGFAFSIESVREGEVYVIIDSKSQEIGCVEIEKTDFPQVEESTHMEGKSVVKNVKVRFACLLKMNMYNQRLINITPQEVEIVEGTAEVVKERGSNDSVVRCIKDVYFQSLGWCTLHQEL